MVNASVAQPDDMKHLPVNQDVILAQAVDWPGHGPFQDQRLEQIALQMFAVIFPMAEWGNPGFRVERNTCRRLALQLHVDFLRLDRLTASNAAERLTDEFSVLLFGDRRLGRTLRGEIHAFSEAVVSDLAMAFAQRLMLPAHIEANHLEVEQEANDGR